MSKPPEGEASQRARMFVAEELHRRKITQRQIAAVLDCSQSKAAKILKGRVRLTVDNLERLCEIAGTTLVEAVREKGREYVADLTPSEMLFLTHYRQQPEGLREHWLSLMVQTARVGQTPILKPGRKSGKTPTASHGVPYGDGSVSDFGAPTTAQELATTLIYKLTPLATGAAKRSAMGRTAGKKP